ncbi:MAG: NlpC/P60 family protein [Roseburia sp.]
MKRQNYSFLGLGIIGVICVLLVIGFLTGSNGKQAGEGEEISAGIQSRAANELKTVEEIQERISVRENVRYINSSAYMASSEVESEGIASAENTEESMEEMGQQEPEQEAPNLVIADVTNYVNIRDAAGEEGEIVGKLYDDSVGILLGTEGDWYYIESGSVTGYVKGEFVLTGMEAKIRADEVGARMARVTTTTLKVRMEPSLEAKVLGLVPEGDLLTVSEEVDGFVKVSVEEGEGYVSTDYVDLYTENVVAESIEEEQERLAREEAERKRAEEAARKAIEQKKTQSSSTTSSNGSATSSTGSTATSNSSAANSSAQASKPAAPTTSLGQQIVNYAVQFVGNPYVYGGTSLTQGTDCSGFVMRVYENFGISLPRTSGEQGKSGRSVASLSEAQPGDLIWYSGHIGIYMGNNQVVHASNEREGIKISNADYRTILGIRRIV